MFRVVNKASEMMYASEELDSSWKSDLENYIENNKEGI